MNCHGLTRPQASDRVGRNMDHDGDFPARYQLPWSLQWQRRIPMQLSQGFAIAEAARGSIVQYKFCNRTGRLCPRRSSLRLCPRQVLAIVLAVDGLER
jgi:hypothetical protein